MLVLDVDQHIELNPEVAVGKPIIKGTRIPVELVLDLMVGGASESDILNSYPHLRLEQLRACVAYAARLVREERIFPRGA